MEHPPPHEDAAPEDHGAAVPSSGLRPLRWGRAIEWFTGSLGATVAALYYLGSNPGMLEASAHAPMTQYPQVVLCLLVVLMAPFAVVVGSLLAVRREPFQMRLAAKVVVLVLLALNLTLVAVWVIGTVSPAV